MHVFFVGQSLYLFEDLCEYLSAFPPFSSFGGPMASKAPLPRMFLLPTPIKFIPQPRGMWPNNPCLFNLNLIPLCLRGPFVYAASSLLRAYILVSRMHAEAQRMVPPRVWVQSVALEWPSDTFGFASSDDSAAAAYSAGKSSPWKRSPCTS